MNQEKMRQYARLLVKVGVNVQPSQTLVIRSPVECAPLVRLCADEAYQCGCREVIVDWRDDELDRQRYLMADDSVFDEYAERDRLIYEIGFSPNAVMLDFYVSDPDLMAGVDPQRIARARKARMNQIHPLFQRIYNKTAVQCTASPPITSWAKKVFPDLQAEEALETLWDKLFTIMRIDGTGDAAEEWARRFDEMNRLSQALDRLELKSLHYRNSLGTDLVIGMPEKYSWQASFSLTKSGQQYVGNMPTEEIYTAPKRDGVNGIVYGSLPLVYQGCLIRDFWLRFENGKVAQVGASQGEDILRTLVNYDENASYLGEAALVPCDSAIGKTGLLFYNPLYDENASCHLALGMGIVKAVPGGDVMSPEELIAHGINHSGIHLDFMIGTPDLSITGITGRGEEIAVFKAGKFAPGLLNG